MSAVHSGAALQEPFERTLAAWLAALEAHTPVEWATFARFEAEPEMDRDRIREEGLPAAHALVSAADDANQCG